MARKRKRRGLGGANPWDMSNSHAGYKVVWCSGSKRVATLKQAVRLARSKSTAQHDKNGCTGAKVLRTSENLWAGKGGAARTIMHCKRRVCKAGYDRR